MNTKENASLRFPRQQEIVWKSEAGRKQVRLDSIPPNSGSGIDASKKLELPPTKKDELKAPSKKSRSTIKKEKPKHSPPKVKGAELWRDCPAEFLSAAKAGLVSARISIPSTSFGTSPGPGLILKEIGADDLNFTKETSAISQKIDSASKKLLNTRSKPNRISPKPKGKSK
ncbi:MAG: hypothetical protein ACRECJ_08770 [Limisphaerales bacterium]